MHTLFNNLRKKYFTQRTIFLQINKQLLIKILHTIKTQITMLKSIGRWGVVTAGILACLQMPIQTNAQHSLNDQTIILPPLADAKVNDAFSEADKNFGDDDDMLARNKPTGWAFESYLKFSLSEVNEVSAAKLRVFGRNPNNNREVRVAVFNTDTDWQELEITFNNAPGREGAEADAVNVDGTPQYYEWDVTSIVQSVLEDNPLAEEVAFVLASTTVDPRYDRAKFNTKEANDHPPLLVLSISDEEPKICTPRILEAKEDGYTNNAPSLQNNSFGDKSTLIVRNKPNGFGYESYLKFNMGDLSTADRVVLQIFGNNPNNDDPVEVGIFTTSNDWEESTLTFNNAPAAPGSAISTTTVDGDLEYYEFDVTSAVLSQLGNSDYISFVLKSLNTDIAYDRVVFNSSERGENTPKLLVECFDGTENRVTLKAEDGKDAQVWSLDPDGIFDRGTDRRDIVIYEWTSDGIPGTKYGLIDFDFSSIPDQAKILKAELSLFHDPGSVDEGHSQRSGSNEAYIRRITSDWDETVAWGNQPSTTNENQTLLPASTSSTQNYVIDVTALTQDIIDDKAGSFGYLIRLVSEEFFRSLTFASGEHPDPTLRPTLEVIFEDPNSNIQQQPSFDRVEVQTEDIGELTEMTLYPNPTNAGITLSFTSSEEGRGKVNVLDMTGRVMSFNFFDSSGSEVKIDLSLNDITAGMYLLEVQLGESRWTRRFVKQ